MLGTYIGDIVGSVYEWHNIKTKDFILLKSSCFFTDDSVMTCAVANALHEYFEIGNSCNLHEKLISEMRRLGRKYPNAGYGGRFSRWLSSEKPQPYNSFGNGSAMRVSAAGWYAESLAQAEEFAQMTAEVTHNHPEGIKGACAVAAAIFLARAGRSKEEIRSYINEQYYSINFTLDEIRESYTFDETCQGSVPQAIEAFLEGDSFEDTLRNAISIGGDSDTIAAISGSIAEAFFGIPEEIKQQGLSYLDEELTHPLIACKALT